MRTLILLALIGTAFAAPEPRSLPRGSSRIIGGSPADISQYPYTSSMQIFFDGQWMWICGGSLITPNTILSAAHCYYRSLVTNWRVRLGSTFASNGGDVHTMFRYTIYEDYDSEILINDVALVYLTAPANTESPNIGLARIPGPNYIIPDNTRVTAVGWGSIAPEGPSSEELLQVDFYTINQQLCSERYLELYNFPNITDDMLCTGILDVGGKDSCYGDSGGPVVHLGDTVVGITSWGHVCAHAYWPRVNARVSYFSDWIVQNAI